MARISIGSVDTASIVAQGAGVRSRGVVEGDDQPLRLHIHELEPGASTTLTADAGDAWIYVWQGDALAGGRRLGTRGSAGLASGAGLDVTAGASGARLLEFRLPKAAASRRDAVRLLPSEDVPFLASAEGANVRIALHADGETAGLSLWMHEVDYGAGAEERLHHHSADEIIFVREGGLQFGDRLCGPGSALAIPGGARYSFTAGPDGLSFVNFRGRQSTYTPAGGEERDEITMWREYVPRPKYLAPAQVA
jgi:hypothetical protein